MAQTTAGTPTIGEVIRAWRVFRGLRLIDLAEKAAVPKGYVSALEHDRKTHPWRDNLKKLAAALGISLQDIDDRRMPPAKAAGKAHQTAGQGTHAISPPHPSTAQALQPPAAPSAEGGVLQQLLEQMQTLTVKVSRVEAELADLKQRVVISSSWVHHITGRWEGNGQQKLPRGKRLTLPSELGGHLEVPRTMTLKMGMRFTLESADDAGLLGNGELEFDFHPLGIDFVKTVAGKIKGGRLKEDRSVAFQLTYYMDGTKHIVHMSSKLSEDGCTLSGRYRAIGFTTKEGVTGDFSLEKVSDVESGVRDRDEGAPARET